MLHSKKMLPCVIKTAIVLRHDYKGGYGYKDSAESITDRGGDIAATDVEFGFVFVFVFVFVATRGRGSSGGSMDVAACRHRGGDIAITVVEFVYFCLCFCCSTPMGSWCPTSSWPCLLPQTLSLVLLSHKWRQRWHQRRQPW
jgi:hypothetical protein